MYPFETFLNLQISLEICGTKIGLHVSYCLNGFSDILRSFHNLKIKGD